MTHATPRLRPSVRALLRDDPGRVLLCRIELEDGRTPVDGVVFGPRRMADLLRELDDPSTEGALTTPRQIGL